MDPLVLSAGAGSGSPVHTQVSCPTASLIHQAFPAGKGKRSHPDSVTLSLRTANDLPWNRRHLHLTPATEKGYGYNWQRNPWPNHPRDTVVSPEKVWTLQLRPSTCGTPEKLLSEVLPGMEQKNGRKRLLPSVLARNLNPKDPVTASAWATGATNTAQRSICLTAKNRMTDLCNTPGEGHRA